MNKISRPDIRDLNRFCDWIELRAIYSGKKINKSKLLTEISHLGGGEDESEIEYLVDSCINELVKREVYYGNSCPYTIRDNNIFPTRKWKEIPEYVMCLIFSIQGVKDRSVNDGTSLFEDVSLLVIKSFLKGDAIRLGFPNKTSLANSIDNICSKLGEAKGLHNPKSTDKDKGVDIIAWLSMNDTRSNSLVILIQCGAGKNWYEKKPINDRTWSKFIDFAASPTKGIVIPVIVESEKWTDYSHQYELIFDRVRIIRLLQSTKLPTKMKQEIKSWCNSKL
jgi:hypothetical protein